jgi:hypothetical protein
LATSETDSEASPNQELDEETDRESAGEVLEAVEDAPNSSDISTADEADAAQSSSKQYPLSAQTKPKQTLDSQRLYQSRGLNRENKAKQDWQPLTRRASDRKSTPLRGSASKQELERSRAQDDSDVTTDDEL